MDEHSNRKLLLQAERLIRLFSQVALGIPIGHSAGLRESPLALPRYREAIGNGAKHPILW